MKIFILILSVYLFVRCGHSGYSITGINDSWVCPVKRTCLDCLRLSQCTWCKETSECFSRELPNRADFCKENSIPFEDKGMSIEDNAKCACFADELEQDCYRPDGAPGEMCSNRGKCECGRCVCDTNPDMDHTSKVIIGKYCELDNFSCDDPMCNEGPYDIDNPTISLKTNVS